MELRKIDVKSKDRKQIKKIYMEAFPAEERTPYWVLTKKAKKPTVDFYGIYDGDRLVGFTYIVKGNNLAYIFYLAIKKEERGHGYGGQVFQLLNDKYHGMRMILALEQMDEKADNYSQRLSRHRFYENCGLQDMPYQIQEASVVYDVMGTGSAIDPKEYGTLMKNYLGPVLGRMIRTWMMEK